MNKRMQVVIMAGGEGSRLRPLTCDIPKPMARLCGRPVMEYILDLLERHGVDDAAVTLRYLPNVVTGYFGQKYGNISLRFVVEDKPLGTAGSVRGACNGAEGDVLVISGDALTDFDLSSAADFHRESGAAATLVVTRVDDPREYGLVQTDDKGRIIGFLEKPGWSQAVSDMANTGIYILSPSALALIPEGREFDFAKDLFPLMMEKNMPLYAFEDTGYWCDIGSLATYLSCQSDILDGKVRDITPDTGTASGEGYVIIPPVYIGKGVNIGEGARVGPYVVMDDGCHIGSCAKVHHSVLMETAYVGDRASLTGTVLCHGAAVKRGASLFEGAVIGTSGIVGEYSTILPDIKVWPGKHVDGNTVLRDHLRDGGGVVAGFDETGLCGETGVELTPELCARVGAAVGSVSIKSGNVKIAVGHGGDSASESLTGALISGILSTGGQVWNFGSCIPTQFDFFIGFSRIQTGVYIAGGVKSSIRLVTGGGLPAPRRVEREVETRLAAGDFIRAGWENIERSVDMSGMGQLYRQELMGMAPMGLTGLHATVRGAEYETVRLLEGVLRTLGCEAEGDDTSKGMLRIYLGAGGQRLSLYDSQSGYVWPEQTMALSCMIELESGRDVALPYDAPRAVEEIAEQYHRQIVRYYSCPADSTDAEARRVASSQLWARDGLMTAIRILHYMKTTGQTLSTLVSRLPNFAVTTKTVECTVNPGSLLQHLSPKQVQSGEGARISTKSGMILVRPSKRGKSLILTAEAADAELAAELCTEMEQQIASFSLTSERKGSNM